MWDKLKSYGYIIEHDKLGSWKWSWKKFRFIMDWQDHPHRFIATKKGVSITIESFNNRDFNCWVKIHTDDEILINQIIENIKELEER